MSNRDFAAITMASRIKIRSGSLFWLGLTNKPTQAQSSGGVTFARADLCRTNRHEVICTRFGDHAVAGTA